MLTSRQPIWIGWGQEVIKFYNDPYKAIVGGKHPWALGKPASEVWKDIWRDIEPMLHKVMKEDEGTYVESQLLLMERNGYPEETYYTFSYTPIPGDDGRTAGVFCANTDDTDKIISERQLRTLTQLGKALADCRDTEEIIDRTIRTLQDNQQDFPFALFYTIEKNKALLAQASPLGSSEPYVPAEIDLTAANDVTETIQAALASRKPRLFEGVQEKIGPMPKGAWEVAPDRVMVLPVVQAGVQEPYGVLVAGLNPHRLPDEKYTGFISLVSDQIATAFAEVHALAEERRRAQALAEIDQAKTAFFSNISHEFRTPLTLMMAPLEDALSDPDTIAENRLRLKVAYDNVQRLQKLVNNLLDFSRIEAGRMQARFERVCLSESTLDLVASFRSAIEKAGLALSVDVEKGMEAYVDTDMWEKVVLNLLSNAFKYTHQGTIRVRLKREDTSICLEVADTGVGIPAGEQEKVFERFHRIQNTGGRSQEGTGIGLALVKELVGLHHGRISVESAVGVGTTFRIVLPAGREHLPAGQVYDATLPGSSQQSAMFLNEALKWGPAHEAAPQAQGTSAPAPVAGPKPKILLADDNTDMREYLERLLQAQFEVTAVGNGRLAWERMATLQPDLVLSDVMMPEMDGFELARRLKGHPDTRNTPVILLSARAGEEATIEGLQTGVDDYLVKPFSARELLSRISSNIRLAQSRTYAYRQLHRLFMDAPVAIAILKGPDHVFELANERYVELVARPVVGKALLEALPEVGASGIKELLDSVFATGTPFFGNEYEVPLVRNGISEQCYFNFAYTPMYDLDNTISGVLIVASDVTETVRARYALKQNEARLESEVQARTADLVRINQRLERSNKQLEQYAFVASHDLQEPLRKVQTFAGMLYNRNKAQLDDTSKTYYDKIIGAAQRMSALVNDLLDLSRLTKPDAYRPMDLSETVGSVVQDLDLLIQEQGAQVRWTALPTIDGIPLQLHQLFSNLLGNALKFTVPGRPPVIEITAADAVSATRIASLHLPAETRYVEIIVRDNGIGFEPQYREKIFEIFQRLHDRSTYSGTGIGLALCARIAANHHGAIFADGEEGAGASFHLVLPLRQEAAAFQ